MSTQADGNLWENILRNFAARVSTPAPITPPSQDAQDGISRDANGVEVYGKDLVMQVFLDAEGNYSVEGYASRTKKCFGEIYLGLDRGADYEAQSKQANAAIQAVSGREAFDQALAATRQAVAALGHPFDIQDIQEISDRVLAALCTYWFDLPDESNVFSGGWRLANVFPPVRCPGDFAPPSGYIFNPDPEFLLAALGEWLGRMLRPAVLTFVAARRNPENPPKGSLSRALFAAFPESPAQDDLLARTIIGVMMGMLPTVDGNITAVARSLWQTGEFQTLQTAFANQPGDDAYLRARTILKDPLMRTMQQAPVPDAVWRTAVKEHTLGTLNPVRIYPGDKVRISIAKATRADLAAGTTDVFAVFGGDRSQHPHPTHACPGYPMAMGVLLGILNGIVEPAAAAKQA